MHLPCAPSVCTFRVHLPRAPSVCTLVCTLRAHLPFGTFHAKIPSVVWLVVQMLAIIAGLLAVVGVLFYALCWLTISLVMFFPIVGKRHRHARWDELNMRSGRK